LAESAKNCWRIILNSSYYGHGQSRFFFEDPLGALNNAPRSACLIMARVL
jgi:hypothetical protein